MNTRSIQGFKTLPKCLTASKPPSQKKRHSMQAVSIRQANQVEALRHIQQVYFLERRGLL